MKHDRITTDPEIMLGKPSIKGTRITVELVLEKLAAGLNYEEILADHPRLVRDDILAVLAFAHDYMSHQDIVLADGQRL